MAKKREVNKAKAVRDYLESQPDAMSGEVAKALNKQGIDMTFCHVSAIYSKLNKTNKLKPGQKRCPKKGSGRSQVRERKPARSAVTSSTERGSKPLLPVAAPPAPAAIATPTKPNGTITLEQIKKVTVMVKALGGFQKMTEVLAVIKEAGGVKKFKELAEAIECPEPDVVVIEPVVL